MSSKEHLQKHIDSLCQELGMETSPYNKRTSANELQTIIDDLESQLPDELDEDGGTTEMNVAAEALSCEVSANDNDAQNLLPAGTPVGIMQGDLPKDATVSDTGIEVRSNDAGDLALYALLTIYVVSHGKRVFIRKGQSVFVEAAAALAAVEEGVGVLLSA